MDTGSATVTNLNILDTSKTNDTGGVENITLAEVGSALFPTTNATQTLTVDAAFWTNHIQLTFQGPLPDRRRRGPAGCQLPGAGGADRRHRRRLGLRQEH